MKIKYCINIPNSSGHKFEVFAGKFGLVYKCINCRVHYTPTEQWSFESSNKLQDIGTMPKTCKESKMIQAME